MYETAKLALPPFLILEVKIDHHCPPCLVFISMDPGVKSVRKGTKRLSAITLSPFTSPKKLLTSTPNPKAKTKRQLGLEFGEPGGGDGDVRYDYDGTTETEANISHSHSLLNDGDFCHLCGACVDNICDSHSTSLELCFRCGKANNDK